MNIIFYVPGMPFNGVDIEMGYSLGGSESAGYYMAREMARQGHGVTVFSAIAPEAQGTWEGVRYLPIGPVSPQFPHGRIFTDVVANTPHDVLIAQRVPDVFAMPTASKLRLWWSHDLALRRNLPAVMRQMWNVHGVLAVSDWHRKQIAEVYGIAERVLHVLPNGLDHTLFAARPDGELKRSGKVLLYSSRPERGLENLLGGLDNKPGIMEILARQDPEIILQICGYENTTAAMAGYYALLKRRAAELPNVQWLGPLSKKALAETMQATWLHVYPTEFEETSCITVMEAQATGTPVVATRAGALPETLADAGVRWVGKAGGPVNREKFAKEILKLAAHPNEWEKLSAKATQAAPRYDWAASAKILAGIIEAGFCGTETDAEHARLVRHFIHHSDITPARHVAAQAGFTPLIKTARAELRECYAFDTPEKLPGHYAGYYAREEENGVKYGPEVMDGNSRFEEVAKRLEGLPDGAWVLDFGCAHGHYTINLAKRFPKVEFLGIDLAASNIDKAWAWAKADKIENVLFRTGQIDAIEEDERFNRIIAAEVLEHVPGPAKLADDLAAHLKPKGRMIITTPYGPWEAIGYKEHWPWRAHLHHFEREDLAEMFGNHPGYHVSAVPGGRSKLGEVLGSFVAEWEKPTGPSRSVDMARKIGQQRPRETLSVCMIVRPDGDVLARALRSVADIADEVIVAVDCGGSTGGPQEGRAWEIAREFGARVFGIKSPLIIGFDEARNATIKNAAGDWILWLDDDEVLLKPERLLKYLQPNQFDAYGMMHDHFAVDQGGLMKRDLPCRLFRNRAGFQFYGVVHEHPEMGLNKGPGTVYVIPDLTILHNGYVDEETRRARFERNFPLLVRDREKYPERRIGHFFWVRDLYHCNQFEMERNGGVITNLMVARAEEGIALWRKMLADNEVRMAVEALPYYSQLVGLNDEEAFDGTFTVLAERRFEGTPPTPKVITGRYACRADAEAMMNAAIRVTLDPLNQKYW